MIFRLTLDTSVGLPRRLEHVPSLYPRGWGKRTGSSQLPQFTSVTALANGDLLLLASSGVLYRLGADGGPTVFARLPHGQYTRTHLATSADGTGVAAGCAGSEVDGRRGAGGVPGGGGVCAWDRGLGVGDRKWDGFSLAVTLHSSSRWPHGRHFGAQRRADRVAHGRSVDDD